MLICLSGLCSKEVLICLSGLCSKLANHLLENFHIKKMLLLIMAAFNSTALDSWAMPLGRARGQNLGHI